MATVNVPVELDFDDHFERASARIKQAEAICTLLNRAIDNDPAAADAAWGASSALLEAFDSVAAMRTAFLALRAPRATLSEVSNG